MVSFLTVGLLLSAFTFLQFAQFYDAVQSYSLLRLVHFTCVSGVSGMFSLCLALVAFLPIFTGCVCYLALVLSFSLTILRALVFRSRSVSSGF